MNQHKATMYVNRYFEEINVIEKRLSQSQRGEARKEDNIKTVNTVCAAEE